MKVNSVALGYTIVVRTDHAGSDPESVISIYRYPAVEKHVACKVEDLIRQAVTDLNMIAAGLPNDLKAELKFGELELAMIDELHEIDSPQEVTR